MPFAECIRIRPSCNWWPQLPGMNFTEDRMLMATCCKAGMNLQHASSIILHPLHGNWLSKNIDPLACAVVLCVNQIDGWWYLWKDPKRNDRKAFPQMFGPIPSWRQDGTAKLWTMDDYDCIKESQTCKCFGVGNLRDLWPVWVFQMLWTVVLICFDWDICDFVVNPKPESVRMCNLTFMLRYKTDRPLNDIAISPLYCSESVGVALLTFDIYHLEIIIAPYKPPPFGSGNPNLLSSQWIHHPLYSCYSSLWTSPDPELSYYPPWPGLQDAPADGWWTGCQGAATGFWIDSKFDSDIRILHN